MLAYLVRRLALMVPVAFLVSVAVFSLIHLTPVDPAELILGEEHSPQAVPPLDGRFQHSTKSSNWAQLDHGPITESLFV